MKYYKRNMSLNDEEKIFNLGFNCIQTISKNVFFYKSSHLHSEKHAAVYWDRYLINNYWLNGTEYKPQNSLTSKGWRKYQKLLVFI